MASPPNYAPHLLNSKFVFFYTFNLSSVQLWTSKVIHLLTDLLGKACSFGYDLTNTLTKL